MCNVSLFIFTVVLFINIHVIFKHICPINTRRKSCDVVDFLDVGRKSDGISYLKMKRIIFL